MFKIIDSIVLFNNGNIAVLDEEGNQMSELHRRNPICEIEREIEESTRYGFSDSFKVILPDGQELGRL